MTYQFIVMSKVKMQQKCNKRRKEGRKDGWKEDGQKTEESRREKREKGALIFLLSPLNALPE